LPTTITISGGLAVGAIDWAGVVAGGTSLGGNQGDPLTTFTQPTCPQLAPQPITGNGDVCTLVQWPTPDALCATGNIPALTCNATTCNYGTDWGALIGLNAPLGASFHTAAQALAVTYSGPPAGAVVRLQVTVGGTTYCSTANVSTYESGTVAPLSSFNTTCWAPTSAGGLSSFSGLTEIALEIVSGPSDIAFTSFCLRSLTFS
jgi:hypothetical protein